MSEDYSLKQLDSGGTQRLRLLVWIVAIIWTMVREQMYLRVQTEQALVMFSPLWGGSRTHFQSVVVILKIKTTLRVQTNSPRRWVR